jgi:hypothetical protein
MNNSGYKILKILFRFKTTIVFFGAFHAKALGDSYSLGEGLTTESAMPMLLKKILGELRTWLPILLGDSRNLREGFTP